MRCGWPSSEGGGCLTRLWALAAADVEGDEGVDLGRLHHLVDLQLFRAGPDAPAAGADLDGGDAHLVVDVGVGPDAGALRHLALELLPEEVLVDLLEGGDEWLHALAL